MKEFEGEKSEVVIEDESKGYTFNQLNDKNSPFRRTKKQIINEPNSKLLDYIKPPYPILKKTLKKEMEVG